MTDQLRQAEPSQWRDMVVATLVREGINKHRARELADHFAAQPEQEPVRFITPPGPITQYTIPTQSLPDEIVRLAGVALHEMPRPRTDWHSCAKLVCEAVVAHNIKEGT